MFRSKKSILFSSVAVLALTTLQANAGGFALREQSAYGQGSSFAGIAAGGALSSMFWNPAAMTQIPGKGFEIGASGILPKVSQSGTASVPLPGLGYTGGVDNSGVAALVPSSYVSWQFNDRLWVGMGINAPSGLAVSFPQLWAGSIYAQSTEMKTYNFNPTVAYKINDWISVGLGVQAQYMKVSYGNVAVAFPSANLTIDGNGWGYGWTAGVTLTPLPKTQIGVGYRSAINQDLGGSLYIPPGALAGGTPGSLKATLNLPDMVTVGLRQGIGDRFTLLGGFEWTNWSRIGTTNVYQPNGSPLLGPGGAAVKFPFEYRDGYLYSIGGEYIVQPGLMLRSGIAFESSPITDQVRTPRIPDNDRTWYSVGASYKPPQLRGLSFDLAYSYVQVKSTPLNVSTAAGNPWAGSSTYVGDASSHLSILSFAATYRWDDAAPAPRHQRITK